MKLLVLGATGRTGKLVLETALQKGCQVTCLARNIARINPQDGLTCMEGNCEDPEHLKNAITGCDAVINVLNISRKSDFPWAKLRTPKNYISTVMELLLKTAANQDLKRIVICSAWGVAETKKDIPKWFKWFIDNSNIGAAYREHERQEQILTASNLAWTIVRPVGLSNSKKKERIKVTFENNPKPNILISRKSVANYLVACLEDDNLIHKKVVISKQ